MKTTKTNSFAAAAFAGILLSVGGLSLATPAMAYDDDVEFVCGENDDGTDWCVSVEDLKAECPLSDPESTTDECAGLETSIDGNRGPQIFLIGGRDASRHMAIIGQSTSDDNSPTRPTGPNTPKPTPNTPTQKNAP